MEGVRKMRVFQGKTGHVLEMVKDMNHK